MPGPVYACRAYLVRGTGLEPVSEDWQPSILAARRTQHKMEREERIELS